MKTQKKNDKIRGSNIFDDWIQEGYSCRQLGKQYKKNLKDIKTEIRKNLDENEIFQIDLVF
ncbi:hypothetical protein N9J72_00945 [Candidatus Gracilibacteria bacterium]|nr:hypothetical protein [Candidatus Gracilibacteria bacterium]